MYPLSPTYTTRGSRGEPDPINRLDQPPDSRIHERKRREVSRLDSPHVSLGQRCEDLRLLAAVRLRNREGRELVRTKPFRPSVREMKWAVGLIKADDHCKRPTSLFAQEFDGPIDEKRRLHGFRRQSHRSGVGIQPHSSRIDHRTPRPAKVTTARPSLPQAFFPIRCIDPHVKSVLRLAPLKCILPIAAVA